MSEKPTKPVASKVPETKTDRSVTAAPSTAPTKGDRPNGASNNMVTKSVAIGIGSAAIVAALMFVRRR